MAARLTGWHECIKYLLFAFNFLFWLLGCTIIVIGIWILIDPDSILSRQHSNTAFHQFLDDSSHFGYQTIAAYLLIAVGVVVIVIGFLGCCGALRHSEWMLITFFILLSIIFVILLTAGVVAVLSKDKMEEYIRGRLEKAVHNYDNDSKSRSLMDFVQANFKCCGATKLGAKDYGEMAPSSCANYVTPCPDSVYFELSQNLVIIAGVTIGIAVVVLMGMAFSLTLCCAVRSIKTR